MGHTGHTAEVLVRPSRCSIDLSLADTTPSAMPPLHHRHPGIVGLLGEPDERLRLYFSLIADGHHVHPNVVRIAYKASEGKCILVTDGKLSWVICPLCPASPLHMRARWTQVVTGNIAGLRLPLPCHGVEVDGLIKSPL
jgi:hypothetical protein